MTRHGRHVWKRRILFVCFSAATSVNLVEACFLTHPFSLSLSLSVNLVLSLCVRPVAVIELLYVSYRE